VGVVCVHVAVRKVHDGNVCGVDIPGHAHF
jgi:hypothetical protein